MGTHIKQQGSTKIQCFANGKAFTTEQAKALPDFLGELGLKLGKVVVELNGNALTPSEAKSAQIQDGDRLEIVRIVAGG